MALEHEMETAMLLARQAGDEIMRRYGHERPRLKGDRTPVTDADIASNEIIVAGLQRAFPGDGIISEELPPIPGGRTWYIDPIDGTNGFIAQSGEFAVHIGLCEGETPSAGIIYRPATGDMYCGVVGEGAYRIARDGTRTPLRVLPPGGGLVACMGREFADDPAGKRLLETIGATGVTLTGGQGLRVLRVVENLADICPRTQPSSTWDICAPHAILVAAGGHILGTSGMPLRYHGQGRMEEPSVAARDLAQLQYVLARMR